MLECQSSLGLPEADVIVRMSCKQALHTCIVGVVLHRLLVSQPALLIWCRQDLQMRLLSLFVDFALNPLEGKQVWDLGALLPAIAALSQDLPAHHAVAKNTAHSNSFDILQVMQEDDANRIKVDCIKQVSAFMDSMGLAVVKCWACFTAG